MARRLMQIASTSRAVFTNDLDHSSEPSREGSVQIIESHRHTFSVPSSDDEVDSQEEEDEVQIASSVHGDEEISAATTPDRPAVGKAYQNTEEPHKCSKTELASGETHELNSRAPSLYEYATKTGKDGRSQGSPVNNLGYDLRDLIDVDTESEDDGPEVLPFYEYSETEQSNRPKVSDEPQVSCQTFAFKAPPMTTVAQKENDQDSEMHRYSIVPETQAKGPNEDEVGGHQPTSVRSGSVAGATTDYDSEDDDELGYHEDFLVDEDLEQFPESPTLGVEQPTSSKPKATFQVGNDKPHHTTLTPPFDEFRHTRLGHLSASDAIDVSHSIEPSSAWIHRAPSPSDAALARKASDPKTSLSRDIFDKFPMPQWPATAKTSHSYSTEQIQDQAAIREEPIGAYSWPELQSPEPRLYDQGPFSSQPKAVVPAPRSPKPDNVKSQIRKATVTWAKPHEDNYDVIMNADRLAQTGKQASKITIPSLVENCLAENPGSFKRKYGGMNGSNDVESASKAPKPNSPVPRTSGYKRTFVEVNPAISSYHLEEDLLGAKLRPHVDPIDFMWQSDEDNITQRHPGIYDQDTPLPDAQPRENVLQTSTASISQDSVAEPALGSVSLPSPDQGHDTDGPARKKARTSSSSSGGIGKFVMGVGFGLLGAAAAFVATIPASVYEEALREFNNAV